jgi:signal transduction histidine kinase
VARGFADLLLPTIAAADARAGELVTTQARLIAVSDEVRRDIERKVREGAQQQVVNVALGLRIAGEDANSANMFRRCSVCFKRRTTSCKALRARRSREYWQSVGYARLCLRDRIESVGGVFTVIGPPGNGTTVWCDLPLELPV